MKETSRLNLRKSATCLLLVALGLGCVGCQTFSLTKEEWELQQRGKAADRDVGNAVDFLGVFGSYGAAAARLAK